MKKVLSFVLALILLLSTLPAISIVAPLPFLSRNAPRNGVRNIAPIGNQENNPDASDVGI